MQFNVQRLLHSYRHVHPEKNRPLTSKVKLFASRPELGTVILEIEGDPGLLAFNTVIIKVISLKSLALNFL